MLLVASWRFRTTWRGSQGFGSLAGDGWSRTRIRTLPSRPASPLREAAVEINDGLGEGVVDVSPEDVARFFESPT